MPGTQAQGSGRQQQRIAVCLPAFPRSRSSSSIGTSDTNKSNDNDVNDHSRHAADIMSGTFPHGLQQAACAHQVSLDVSTGMTKHRASSHNRRHSSTTVEEMKQSVQGTRQPHQLRHSSAASNQSPRKAAAQQRPYLGKSLEDSSSSSDDNTSMFAVKQPYDQDEDDCRQQDQQPQSQYDPYRQHAAPVARPQQHAVAEFPNSSQSTAIGVVAAAADGSAHAAGTEQCHEDLDILIRDVAARIIQTHWRRQKQAYTTPHLAQAPKQDAQACHVLHDNECTSQGRQLKRQVPSGTSTSGSAQDQSQPRTRSPHSPGHNTTTQHSMRQAHRAASPNRHASPMSPGPSVNRGQPVVAGRAPPSYTSHAGGAASCLDGITESKTSHYKVYTVAPSLLTKRPDNGCKGGADVAAASLSLLDEDSMPLMAQPSRVPAGAAGLRSSIDSVKRGTRRRMGAVGLSCDLQLAKQQQEVSLNANPSKQWQQQQQDGTQGAKGSRVQVGGDSKQLAEHTSSTSPGVSIQLAWQQEVPKAGPAGFSQQRDKLAALAAGQHEGQLEAETSSSSTQLAEPSFNLDSCQQPDEGVDMPTLLQQLRAGQMPDGVDQGQLQLLLAAIGSTRCSSSTVEQSLEAAQGGPASGTGALQVPDCTAWAELQPAGTRSGSVSENAAGSASVASPSDIVGGTACVPSAAPDGVVRSARAREATREKLRNLRRSVHSSGGAGSILAGHATTVVRTFEQQGSASAGLQRPFEAPPSPQISPHHRPDEAQPLPQTKDRTAYPVRAVEQPVLNSLDSSGISRAASEGPTFYAKDALQSIQGGGEPVGQHVYGAADISRAATVNASLAQEPAVHTSSWTQACTSSSHPQVEQSPGTPTKHTPIAKPPAAAVSEPTDYHLPSDVNAADDQGPGRQQQELQDPVADEAPHYIWPSPCSPVRRSEVYDGSKRASTPALQQLPQLQATQGQGPNQLGVSPGSMPCSGSLPRVSLQQQQQQHAVLAPDAPQYSLTATLHTTDPQNASVCGSSQQGKSDLVVAQQPHAETQAAAAAAAAVSPRSSMNTEKLRSILDFLNDVDQRSMQETGHAVTPATISAAQLLGDGSTHHTHKVVAADMARAGQPQPSRQDVSIGQPTASGMQRSISNNNPNNQVSGPQTRPVAVAVRPPSAQCVADEVLRHAGLLEDAAAGTSHVAAAASLNQLLDGQEESQASLGFDSSLASLPEPHPAWQAASAAAGPRQQAGIPRSSRSSLGSHDGCSSLQGSITSSTSARPAVLAESVFDGVKSKMRRLQEELRERDATCAQLKRELDGTQQRAAQLVADTERRAEAALAASRADHEAALARHLSFMDRLLADKDELNRKVLSMAEAAKAQEERHERTVAKLKEGWVSELKRQKEAWAASERLKREQWQENKAAEVKELTVKGLEVEVQKLLAKHKTEVAAVQQAAADEAKCVLDVVAAQHELAIRQLKEKLAREGEDVIEKERAGAAQRLREASERYEQQLSMQRLRLVADGDLRLEQLEAARREERKRADDALAKAAADADVRVREVEEEARKEREALRRAHDKQMEALRQELSSDQEGWRAALAERSRRDLEQQEAALMERLLRERDEQLQVVVQRLESESQAAKEVMRREASEREAAMASRHAIALKEAKRTEAKLQEQVLSEGEARQAAEARLAAMQAQLEEARHELEARSATIRWLEAQLSAAQQQAQATEAARQAASNQALQEVLRDKEAADRQVLAMQQELQGLRGRHTAEMEHVEARVRAALARKDEALSSSMQQVAMLTAQLKHTEAVLAAQQAELGAL